MCEAQVGEEFLLQADGLVKRYGGVRALDEVSIALRGGEVVGVLGENGAGKSTLVRVLSGAILPDAGTIRVMGEDVRLKSPADARRVGIETVHQELSLADLLSVSENLFLNREIRRHILPLRWVGWLDKKEMERQSTRILQDLRIRIPDPKVRVSALSGGQRQAVVVGRAAAWGRRIVILDEPTAALGVEQAAQVHELIGRLRSEGIGVIVISHNMQEVLAVCDRAVVLRHGRCISNVSTAEVTSRDLVGLITGAITETRASAIRDVGGLA